MICPHCGSDTDLSCRIDASLAAKALGSLGGSVKGKTKARAVDYRAMAALSHQKRRENKAKAHPKYSR